MLRPVARTLSRVNRSARLSLYLTLAASAAVSWALLMFRVWYFDTVGLGFLVWNLILAAVPFIISQWLIMRRTRSAATFFTAAFLWLLFFPNAPYIVTDLMHLQSTGPAPLWFDLVLLLSFAWNGLIVGYLSLLDMQRLIEWRFGALAGWLCAGSAILLGSFGIYLGRVLRWNSWDLFTRPTGLLRDVVERLAHPFDYPSTYGMTFAFAVFMLAGYLFLKSLIRLERSEDASTSGAPKSI